jgi:DNA-binding NarL/FixJ family response regulator
VSLGRRHKPDVAVIDLHMPKQDGGAVVRQLTHLSPQTACMVMSYEKDSATIRDLMAAGARDYLVKPFGLDEFIHAVRRVHQRAQELQAVAELPLPTTSTDAQQQTEIAVSYLNEFRTDDEAAALYQQLAAWPSTDPHLLMRFAGAFLARRDWQTLRQVCDRLLQSTNQ